MNDEIREAFCNWLETEHGVKPIAGIEIDALANMTNPQLFAGFRAAYQMQQTKLDKAVSALEACQKFGVVDATDSFKFETLLKQTLAEIKESK